MENIVKILSSCMLVLFVITSSSAQQCFDNANGSQAGFRILQSLQNHIDDLTEEQVSTIETILSEQKRKIAELKENFGDNDNWASFKEALDQIKAETNNAMHNVLTEEQATVYEALKSRWIDRRGNRGMHHDRAFGSFDDDSKAELKATFLKMRIELDEVISRKDKRKIKALRKVMQAAKSEKRAFFKEWKAKGEKPSKEAMQAAKESWKAKYQQDWDEVSVLVKKYHADIQALFDENEIADVFKGFGKGKACGKGKKDTKGCCSAEEMAACCPGADTKSCGKSGKKDMMKARFLLMNPKGTGEDVSKAETIDAVSTLKISPNPVEGQATITYRVVNEGGVSIDVIDESGNVMRNLLNEYKKAGTYQLNLNANDFKSKIYFVVIKDEVGINNEKLIINQK